MVVVRGILPVFMIIALGTLARRQGWMDERFIGQLNRLIYLLAIPALLLRIIGRSDLSGSLSLPLVTACVAATTAVGLAVWLAVAVRGVRRDRRGVLVQAATRGNLAYVGFPVILATGGESALRLAAVTAAVLIPFQNLLSIAALAAGETRDLTRFARVLVLNPVVLGVAGGILWSLSAWPGWVWLNTFLDILGDLALPGALLALGGQIHLDGLRADLRATAVSTTCKLLLLPATGFAMLTALGVHDTALMVGVFLLAAPTAVVSAAIAQSMGGDGELASAAVITASLASFPAYILWGLML